MKLEVSTDAANWYKNELNINTGEYVQFYVKLYGGIPTVNPNYSLGVSVGKVGTPIIHDLVEGIHFYFNENDAWFLDEYDMKILVEKDEVNFLFEQNEQSG